MAISLAHPEFPDMGNFAFIQPKIEKLDPKATENLIKLVDNEWDNYAEVEVDLSNVKILTNVAARMICKHVLKQTGCVELKGYNEAVYRSLDWAADYLVRKGELDRRPWQLHDPTF